MQVRSGSDPADEAAHGPPVLFVHVMKAGGTTVMRHLRETYPLEQIYPYAPLDLRYHDDGELDLEHHLSVPYLLSLPPERVAQIRVYTGHLPYVVRELLGFETRAAALLRDPVERTISLLHQLKRRQPWEERGADRRPLAERTLEEMYEHPLAFEPLIHNHQTKVFSMTSADEPVGFADVIEVDRGRLALAKANLAQLDVLGVTERFDAFLDEAHARFGWTIVRGARKNVTPEDERQVVSPAFRRRIAEDNALDVELHEWATARVAALRGDGGSGA